MPGRERGFQTPALNALALPVAAIALAVLKTCSLLSALHGPAITIGLFNSWLNQLAIGSMLIVCFLQS